MNWKFNAVAHFRAKTNLSQTLFFFHSSLFVAVVLMPANSADGTYVSSIYIIHKRDENEKMDFFSTGRKGLCQGAYGL